MATLGIAFPERATAATNTDGTAIASRLGEASVATQMAELQQLVDRVRRQHGVRALRDSRQLDRSASLRAAAIARCGQVSHTPCGQSFISVFRRVGYAKGTYTVGENLAWGTGALGSAERAIRGWLSSPPHRTTLLSPRWRDVGVARVVGPGGGAVWVAQFGRRG